MCLQPSLPYATNDVIHMQNEQSDVSFNPGHTSDEGGDASAAYITSTSSGMRRPSGAFDFNSPNKLNKYTLLFSLHLLICKYQNTGVDTIWYSKNCSW